MIGCRGIGSRHVSPSTCAHGMLSTFRSSTCSRTAAAAARPCRCDTLAYCGTATASATAQSLQPGTCLLSNETVAGRVAGSNAKGSAVSWSSGYLIPPPAPPAALPPAAAPEVGGAGPCSVGPRQQSCMLRAASLAGTLKCSGPLAPPCSPQPALPCGTPLPATPIPSTGAQTCWPGEPPAARASAPPRAASSRAASSGPGARPMQATAGEGRLPLPQTAFGGGRCKAHAAAAL